MKKRKINSSLSLLLLVFSTLIDAQGGGFSDNFYHQVSDWNVTRIGVPPKEDSSSDFESGTGTGTDTHFINFSDIDETYFTHDDETSTPSGDEEPVKGRTNANSYDNYDDANNGSVNYVNDTFEQNFTIATIGSESSEVKEQEGRNESENEIKSVEGRTVEKTNRKSRGRKGKGKGRKISKEKEKKRKNKKLKSKEKEDKTTEGPTQEVVKSKGDSRIRLPSSLVPVHYVIRLHPRFEDDFPVTGSVEIEIEAREVTPRIKLHSSNIEIDKSSVQVHLLKAHRKMPIKYIKLNPFRQFLTIKLGRQLKSGRIYVLSIKFKYHLSEEAKGFYKIQYVDSDGKKKHLAATQFWPSDARRAFPCFDEPGMKATFDVHLARSREMKALTNMPLVRNYRKKEEPEWVWDQFATSPNMSTYLLAFVVTNFTSSSSEKPAGLKGTHLKVWSRPSMANRTAFALDVAGSSVQFFEKYFDSDYPLPKMDMIALPKMTFSGMENWGLITYREDSLLLEAETSSAEATLGTSTLVAHEAAHQWFGNLVTFEWWNDLWLNEGFATYMSFLAVDHTKPSWNVIDQFVVTRLQQVMAVDALPSSHSVSSPVKDPSSINEVFDSIPYNKGASLIRMMKHFLSEGTFKKGLQSYLRSYKFKNTRQDNLWNSMTKAAQKDKALPAGISVKGIMDTWTLQKGYPYLHVERYNNGTAFLTQERFLLGKLSSKRRQEKKSKWWIPITFTTQERPSFKHTRAQTWLRQEDDSLQVTGLPPTDKWVIFNLQQTGFYRVNYDESTWHLLIDQLNSDPHVISIINRAQLVDDSLNLARAGLLPYSLAFQLLSYLKREKEYVPWKAGFRNLEYIKDMLQASKDYKYFKEFVLDLLSPLVSLIKEELEGDDEMQARLLRAEAMSWLCQLEHEICRTRAQKVTEALNSAHVEQSKLKVSDPVLCSAIRGDREHTWESLFRMFRTSVSVNEKWTYLRALGCTTYVWLLNRYLELMMEPSSGVLRQDGYQLYEVTAQTPIGSYVAWDHFRSSWNQMKNYSDFASFVAPSILETVTKSFNTQYRLRELQLFKEELRTEPSKSPVLPAVNNAISKLEANIKWMNKNYQTIVQWLNDEHTPQRTKTD